MGHLSVSDKQYTGVFSGIKARLERNRLGELLVQHGVLAPADLKLALAGARSRNVTLGRYLLQTDQVSAFAIRRALTEQFMLRVMIASATIVLSIASFGLAKQANASGITDVPARMAFTQAAFEPVASFPKLFDSTEKRSTSLSAFTKWTGMFEKFDVSMSTSHGQAKMHEFLRDLEPLRDLSLEQMVVGVNDLMNRVAYVTDQTNYGKSDYWATPIEFLTRGGDCEDYAIAKYTALRILGVPEERMRLAIVQDLQKNIPHAILVVYTDNGAVILDNQIKTAIRADNVKHYKPIFSINRTAWWLHTKPENGNVTVVASAAR